MEVLSLIKNSSKPGKLLEVPISQIRTNPNQPRKMFPMDSLEELAMSIKQHGLLQPVTIRLGKYAKYELIAGERRMRACRMAGLRTIPAILIDVSNCDSAALALIENLQRECLHFIDEAEAYNSLIKDFALTQDQLAEKLGKNQATIANKLRILKLSPQAKIRIRENELTERHARALLRLPEEQQRLQVLDLVCEKGLNVKQTEAVVDKMLAPPPPPPPPKKHIRMFKDIRIFSNTIKQAIEMMQQSGIDAVSEKTESEEYIQYTVRIPKTS